MRGERRFEREGIRHEEIMVAIGSGAGETIFKRFGPMAASGSIGKRKVSCFLE